MQKAEKGFPGQRDGGGNECCVQVRARPVCWDHGPGQGSRRGSRRPSGSSLDGESGSIPLLASVCGWHPWSHLIRPSSRGLLSLGERPGTRMLVSGKCQVPSHISGQGLNHLPHQNALGIGYSLEAWRAAWEGRGGGKAYTPGLPACGELQPCGLSPPRLPHPPEVC